jgi:hypothetical protein
MLGARAAATTITAETVSDAAQGLALKRRRPRPSWQRLPRWTAVLIVLLVLALTGFLFVPADRVIDANMPSPPRRPAATAAPAIRPAGIPADVVVRPNGTIQPLRPL